MPRVYPWTTKPFEFIWYGAVGARQSDSGKAWGISTVDSESTQTTHELALDLVAGADVNGNVQY